MVTIRHIRADEDAEAFLDLRHTTDAETTLLMMEPGERMTSTAAQREMIIRMLEAGSTILVAEDSEDEARLVGYLLASRGVYQRVRHTVFIVIAVLQAYTGQGIGTRLIEALETWSREQRIQRLELEVQVRNTVAIALYERNGFVIEGTKRRAMIVADEYVDTHFMAKLLE
ncbi:MAG: GNAT family N-acetyltransferase [Chloroflexi bacterium]|nr:GNAT family N-acetyltransferase [Chloroflexota bacterium]